jgi:hypothetical protein
MSGGTAPGTSARTGSTADRAGLSLLPMTLAMAAAALVAGHLMGTRGPRIPLVLSGVLMGWDRNTIERGSCRRERLRRGAIGRIVPAAAAR